MFFKFVNDNFKRTYCGLFLVLTNLLFLPLYVYVLQYYIFEVHRAPGANIAFILYLVFALAQLIWFLIVSLFILIEVKLFKHRFISDFFCNNKFFNFLFWICFAFYLVPIFVILFFIVMWSLP